MFSGVLTKFGYMSASIAIAPVIRGAPSKYRQGLIGRRVQPVRAKYLHQGRRGSNFCNPAGIAEMGDGVVIISGDNDKPHIFVFSFIDDIG